VVFLRQPDGSTQIRQLAQDEDGLWGIRLASVEADLSFDLRLDKARSEAYAVRVLARPVITGVEVGYKYPSYTRRKPEKKALGGRTITALEGTKLRIALTSNVDLRSATARIGEQTVKLRINPGNRRVAVRHHILNASGRMEVDLVSTDGLRSKQLHPLVLRAIPDAPPSVNITGWVAGKTYFASDTVPLTYRAQDDIGLAELSIMAPGRVEIPILVEPFGTREIEQTITIPASTLVVGSARSAMIRVQALDTKGQVISSQSVKLTLAVNSYDRQLRDALTVFEYGRPPRRSIRSVSAKRLDLHLVGLRRAAGYLKVLLEGLAAGKPLTEKTQTNYRNQIAGTLKGLGFQVDLIPANLNLQPRLQQDYLFATGTVALASHAESLLKSFEEACGGGPPAGALKALQGRLQSSITRQEKANEERKRRKLGLMRELLGYQSSVLAAAVEETQAAKNWDDDHRTSGRVQLKQILALLKAGAGEGAPEEVIAVLRSGNKEKNDETALIAAAPLLRKLTAGLIPLARTEALRAVDAEITAAAGLARLAGRSESLDMRAMLIVNGLMVPTPVLLDEVNALNRYLAERAQGKAGGVPSFSSRDGLLWQLQDALLGMHAQAQGLRVLLALDGSQSREADALGHWVALREKALALQGLIPRMGSLDQSLRDRVKALGAKLSFCDPWIPSVDAGTASQFCGRLRQLESECEGLAAVLAPSLQAIAGKMNAVAASQRKLTRGALADYRASVLATSEEMARKKQDTNVHIIYLRLRALQTALLRSYDMAQAARILKGGTASDLPALMTASILAGKATDFVFKELVNVHIPAGQRGTITNLWEGRISLLKDVAGKIAVIESVLADGVSEEELQRIAQEQVVLHLRTKEEKAVRSAAEAERSTAQPKALLDELSGNRAQAHLVWEDPHWGVGLLGDALARKAPEEEIKATAKPLAASMARFAKLPKEIDILPALVKECAEALPADAQQREGLEADLKTIQGKLAARIEAGGGSDLTFPAVRLGRALARTALGGDRSGGALLRWSLFEAETARRWGGFGDQQAAVGGIAIVGENLGDLKLPKHLYLELKRARGGKMPALFKDQSYRYLNLILEKAR
jgi:hypothetical protein